MSCTSPPRAVKPQATCALRPTMTNGVPGSVKPLTSRAPSAVCSEASYQMPGTPSAKCMSLETSGNPLVEREPATAQLFEPERQPSQVCNESEERTASRSCGGAVGCSSLDCDSSRGTCSISGRGLVRSGTICDGG